MTEFYSDVNHLKEYRSVSNKSKLASLNPFLDDQGIIRVGGRLRHANLDNDNKFPIILPTKHSLTKLIIHREHMKQLHSGPQLILSTIRQRFWPLSGRQAVTRCSKKVCGML